MEPDIQDVQTCSPQAPVRFTVTAGITLAEMEKLLIVATLRWTNGNRKKTAVILGVNRATLYNKMKRYGVGKGASAEVYQGEAPGFQP